MLLGASPFGCVRGSCLSELGDRVNVRADKVPLSLYCFLAWAYILDFLNYREIAFQNVSGFIIPGLPLAVTGLFAAGVSNLIAWLVLLAPISSPHLQSVCFPDCSLGVC